MAAEAPKTSTVGSWRTCSTRSTPCSGSGDQFGISVALPADASILAVGAQGEGSAATGVAGNQADNSALNAGAVYVFQ